MNFTWNLAEIKGVLSPLLLFCIGIGAAGWHFSLPGTPESSLRIMTRHGHFQSPSGMPGEEIDLEMEKTHTVLTPADRQEIKRNCMERLVTPTRRGKSPSRGSMRTGPNSLGKRRLEFSTSMSGRACSLKPGQICVLAGVKHTIFTQVFS